MGVAFMMPGYLRQYTGGAARVETDASPATVD